MTFWTIRITNVPLRKSSLLRTGFIFSFYGDPVVWKFLGYEGPSNDLGGYVNRGFGDIEWLGAD